MSEMIASRSMIQPVTAGLLAAVVGFGSSFPIVLQGLAGVGATPAQAASGLLALCLATGVLGAVHSIVTRQPVSMAWSTPGAALLISTGVPEGGFAVSVGAFIVAALLVTLAGIWRPFGRAVVSIPMSLASAMLAGVLLDLCLAPVRAVGALPELALPIVITWALGWRFARIYAVPLAVVVTALIVFVATPIPAEALADIWPNPVFVAPSFTLASLVGIAVPLFIVTMASQNVPGLAVMRGNGYQPKVGPIFISTGLFSAVSALFGGHAVNLAAITAALCAGPEAHPDPARRYLAPIAAGVAYVLLGLFAAFAAAFIAASPPLLIQAVAGLALLSSLAGALTSALADTDERLPAIVTFVTTASGVAFFGIGAAFWGLVAGGLLMALGHFRR
ncbi:benzoate/H(+) symporter BenE family transporter [Skermanella stibiiresistens]|nr:benzoate/H(+) symporter BenE family transporter [Skermanella stibiiresistens]